MAMKYYDGFIEWCDDASDPDIWFRENGPCIIYDDGKVMFSQIDFDWFNRNQGPSEIHPNGGIRYTDASGNLHRIDGPAVIYDDGDKEYWVDDTQLTPAEFFLKYGQI